jgi:hypothetical protein
MAIEIRKQGMVVTPEKKVIDEDLMEQNLGIIRNQPSTFSDISEKLEIENRDHARACHRWFS